jgi:hypothetical protein
MGVFTTIEGIKATVGAWWYAENRLNEMPCEEFPHEVAIDNEVFDKNDKLHRDIRKFIENQLPDTVILKRLGLMYYYAYDRSSNGWQVNHSYSQFFFESEESAIMFKLHFYEHVTDVKTKWKERYIHWENKGKENIWEPNSSRGY